MPRASHGDPDWARRVHEDWRANIHRIGVNGETVTDVKLEIAKKYNFSISSLNNLLAGRSYKESKP